MSTRLDQAGLTWAGDACAYAVPDMYVDVWGKRASKDSVFRNHLLNNYRTLDV